MIFFVFFCAQNTQALSKYIAKNHPEAVDPQTSHQSHPIDWEKAAVFVDKSTRRNNKRDRVHCMRTGEECRLRCDDIQSYLDLMFENMREGKERGDVVVCIVHVRTSARMPNVYRVCSSLKLQQRKKEWFVVCPGGRS